MCSWITLQFVFHSPIRILPGKNVLKIMTFYICKTFLHPKRFANCHQENRLTETVQRCFCFLLHKKMSKIISVLQMKTHVTDCESLVDVETSWKASSFSCCPFSLQYSEWFKRNISLGVVIWHTQLHQSNACISTIIASHLILYPACMNAWV